MYLILRPMSDNGIKGFCYLGNVVHGEPDYGLAGSFVLTADVFANTSKQSVYIIDYFCKRFLYVSPNPLFLCGMSADAVKSEGNHLFIDHVPADEMDMLHEINRSGFSFIDYKLTTLACQSDGAAWLGLSVVFLSSRSDAGHI